MLVLYETLAAALPLATTGGVRNGADVILKSLFIALAGAWGPMIFGVILIGVSVVLIYRDIRFHGSDLSKAVFVAMLVESVSLALVFGLVVGVITAQLLGALSPLAMSPVSELGWWPKVMISLGAGLYEELLFRVLLVSALAFAARRLLGLRVRAAGVTAAVAGAFIFSAFHYVGPYGDALQAQSFVFRMIGGLFFSGLFLLRGFGITAWTHALYDVFLLVW